MELRLFDQASVSHQGELAKAGVEQVSGHITNLPGRSEGLHAPFVGAKTAQQLYKLCVHATEQWRAQDRFRA
jgi:hypothetical protein